MSTRGVFEAIFGSSISSQHCSTPCGADDFSVKSVRSSIGFLSAYLCHYLLKYLSSRSILVAPMKSEAMKPSSSQTSMVRVH